MNDTAGPIRIARRRSLFEHYISRRDQGLIASDAIEGRHTCPCCGYPTLTERGARETCVLCQWQDEGQDDPVADQVWDGANTDYALSEARANYEANRTMYRADDAPAFDRETSDHRLEEKERIATRFDAALKEGLIEE